MTNNAAYLRDIIASGQFRDAKLSTHFIDSFFPDWKMAAGETDAAIAAAAITAGGAMGDQPSDGAARPGQH